MNVCDVLIIGGGPSGSLAAKKIASNGYKVIVLEKEDFPRFVIGESLLPRCNEILEENGLIEKIQKQNYMIKGGAIFIDEEKKEKIIDFSNNLGQKWGNSFQVKREEFDNVLLQEAKNSGVDVKIGYTVINYDEDNNIITAKDTQDNVCTFNSKFVIDASGYGRVLPKLLNLDEPSTLKLRNAIFTRVQGEKRREEEFEGFIDIVIHDDNKAWLWIIPFSDGTTSVGIVCEESYFDDKKMSEEEFFDSVLNSHNYLKEKFKNAQKLQKVGRIRGYSSSIKKMYGKNYVLTGNATEFLDPVFSSGVTLALESSNKAGELVLKTLKGQSVDWENDYEKYMMQGIDVFRSFVHAWYEGKLRKIFYYNQDAGQIERSISSILSGYVWDDKNYFSKNSSEKINTLANMVS